MEDRDKCFLFEKKSGAAKFQLVEVFSNKPAAIRSMLAQFDSQSAATMYEDEVFKATNIIDVAPAASDIRGLVALPVGWKRP